MRQLMSLMEAASRLYRDLLPVAPWRGRRAQTE